MGWVAGRWNGDSFEFGGWGWRFRWCERFGDKGLTVA
jgi:hypothetical protein